MPRLEDIKLFVAVADSGSLTRGARQLNVTAAAASLALKRLETEFKTRFVTRSTRSSRLTPSGEAYLYHARQALDALDAGGLAVASEQGSISGMVSLSMSSDLGRNVVLEWLDEFLEEHPSVSLSVRLGDLVTDLFRDPVDIALRYGKLESSTLIAVPLVSDNRRVLCGSPEYFARNGRPIAPADILKHNCLRYSVSGSVYDRWGFEHRDTGEKTVIRVSGNRVTDDADIVHRWVLDGRGLAYKSRFDILKSLRSGTLETCLDDYMGDIAPLHLIFSHRLAMSPAIQAIRELLHAKVSMHLEGD